MNLSSRPSTPIIILGGGISGLSAAWRLLQQGVPVHILETGAQLGGLAGTIKEKGYHLDFGPHSFFSEDAEIRQTVLDLFEGDLPQIERSVKLHYRGHYLDYPFTPGNLLSKMGLNDAILTIFSYLASRLRKRTPFSEDQDSVEDWAIRNFGKHLYKTFFKPYTEQFWKIPCSQLSARTIPSHTRTSFTQTLKILLQKKVQGNSLLEREKLPTYYPRTGYGEISKKIAEKIYALGGSITCSAKAIRLSRSANSWSVLSLEQGIERERTAAQVISTIPLSNLILMLDPKPSHEVSDCALALEFRPILVLGVITPKQNILNCGYMYTLNRPYNRLTEMNRFSPFTSPPEENILALEIPCTKSDPLWKADRNEILAHCLPALEMDGVLKRSDIKGLLLVKASHAYPIYRKGYKTHLQTVLNYLKSLPGIHSLGRSGEFLYMDADQCMRRAFNLSDSIAQNLDLYATAPS